MLLTVFTLLVTPRRKALLLRVQPRLLKKIGVLFLTRMHQLVIGNMIFPKFLMQTLLRGLLLQDALKKENVKGLEKVLYPGMKDQLESFLHEGLRTFGALLNRGTHSHGSLLDRRDSRDNAKPLHKILYLSSPLRVLPL